MCHFERKSVSIRFSSFTLFFFIYFLSFFLSNAIWFSSVVGNIERHDKEKWFRIIHFLCLCWTFFKAWLPSFATLVSKCEYDEKQPSHNDYYHTIILTKQKKKCKMVDFPTTHVTENIPFQKFFQTRNTTSHLIHVNIKRESSFHLQFVWWKWNEWALSMLSSMKCSKSYSHSRRANSKSLKSKRPLNPQLAIIVNKIT